jgi:hypothetical protein
VADHPTTAQSLNNLAALLQTMGDNTGARPLLQRALVIIEQALGANHPTTITIRRNLAKLMNEAGEHHHSGREQNHSSGPVLPAMITLVHRAVEVLRGTLDERLALLTQLQHDVDQTDDPRAHFFIWTIAQALQGTPVSLLGNGLVGEFATMWADLVGALRDDVED